MPSLELEARYRQAYAQYEQGHYAEAFENFKTVLAEAPDNVNTLVCLALVAHQIKQDEVALACYEKAIALKPNAAHIYSNLGSLYLDKRIFNKAHAAFQKALAIDPNFLIAQFNLGMLYKDQDDYPNAIINFQKVLARDPKHAHAHFNLAHCYLMLGEFEKGWAEYEWRWQRPDLQAQKAQMVAAQWQGESLQGKTILVHSEQGFGDSLQFARFIPLLKNFNPAQIKLICRQPLLRLWQAQDFADEVSLVETALPYHHVHIPDMSLPYALKITQANLPRQTPYLKVPADLKTHWQQKLKAQIPQKNKKIGFAWQGSAQNAFHFRSCDLSYFSELFALPDTTWLSLQKFADTHALTNYANVLNFENEISDFADLAAVMTELDLIISIDTAITHLAGSLGLATWTLLAKPTDWRWQLQTQQSLWYPSMRLFRQATYDDWSSVFDAIKAALL